MSTTARGRCGGCGGGYALTQGGLVRSHEGGPPDRGRRVLCAGAGMPPISADEPLAATRLRDLEREVTDLRRENTALRAARQSDQHLLEAHRLRVRAADRWRELARCLLDAQTADWAAEDERWNARMVAIETRADRIIEQASPGNHGGNE